MAPRRRWSPEGLRCIRIVGRGRISHPGLQERGRGSSTGWKPSGLDPADEAADSEVGESGAAAEQASVYGEVVHVSVLRCEGCTESLAHVHQGVDQSEE